MRDIDLAQRAQQRGFVSSEQLREAKQFAAGGRSLLSVLLDLGHLKPDDLLRLGEAPAKSNRIFWIVTLAALAVAVLGALAAKLAVHGDSEAIVFDHVPDVLAPSFSLQASARGRELLADVEHRLDARGRPPAAAERDLRRAMALIEEAARPENLLPLARIRELLDDWEGSRELYQRALSEGPDSLPALLGAARTSLLLRDPAAARLHAERACTRAAPPAEAYFLRGAAAHAQGDAAGASLHLAEASRLDAAFRPRVEALLSGQLR